MKFLLSLLALIVFQSTFSQDTLDVSSISEAIDETKRGNFVQLSIWNDKSSNFPEDFFSIPQDKLLALIIDDCSYSELPEKLSDYSNVAYFRYYSSSLGNDYPLKTFPNFLTKWENLWLLEIEGAVFSQIPSLSNLLDLEELSLVKCGLTEFPEGILELTNLKNLTLGCNQIVSIPDEIDQLVNLRTLDMSNDFCLFATPPALSYIPKSLSNLPKLKQFNYGNTEVFEWEFEEFFKTLPKEE